MFGLALIVLLSLKGLASDESVESITNDNTKVSVTDEIPEIIPPAVTEAVPISNDDAFVTPGLLRPSRATRRRPRRARGFFNDMRYRNPANNPYNPNSPYAFRGRPGQPPVAYRQPVYSEQYYDPYNQYYGYQGYPPVQPQQQSYYPYPYQPQPQVRMPQPQPPTPPATETIPDLYYVQKSDSPDGQYEYKKVSVVQDSFYESRARRRPTRWPQNTYGGYYNYPYNPYDRRPPPPPPQQQYYQPYQYPQQYPPNPNYYYPRVAGVPRSRLRTGKPPLRSTAISSAWRLTLAPLTTSVPPVDEETTESFTTEPSGD